MVTRHQFDGFWPGKEQLLVNVPFAGGGRVNTLSPRRFRNQTRCTHHERWRRGS